MYSSSSPPQNRKWQGGKESQDVHPSMRMRQNLSNETGGFSLQTRENHPFCSAMFAHAHAGMGIQIEGILMLSTF